ncbi:hypothetical protein GJ496_002488 [Pomphorhynchus laevis]|nr:hypothetical protein GJ496_002488 [Pomphorhynchus laevis]
MNSHAKHSALPCNFIHAMTRNDKCLSSLQLQCGERTSAIITRVYKALTKNSDICRITFQDKSFTSKSTRTISSESA